MGVITSIICMAAFLWWAQLALEWIAAARKGLDLSNEPVCPAACPRLSVIIPARDEEKYLREALSSVLGALPANGEVILVDDRSWDGTAKIARLLAASDTRLRVISIREVPDGWLGKNHALQEGFKVSRGDYFLFTDADVIFEPGCLEKALTLCEKESLDHLVATPAVITKGFWERTFVSFFSILLMSRFRIWRAADPHSRFFAGIGAFNLVRRSAYEKAGTHEALREEVVDDLLLGRLMKRSGGRSKVVSGEDCLKVRWNIGLPGLMTGLEKNAFAAFDYSLVKAAAGCFALMSVTDLPALVLVSHLLSGKIAPSQLAAATSLGVWCAFVPLYQLTSRSTGASWFYFLTFPVGAVLLTWTIIRSAFFYHIRGGIKWRGTLYQSRRKD